MDRGRSRRGWRQFLATVGASAVAVLALVGCASNRGTLSAADGRVQVVTTTGVLRDLVHNVGGDRVNVVSLVPDRADPHAYEPTLRDVRNVVYADVAFSNYLLLEERNVITALDANLPDGAENISVAEEAVKYAAEVIPLVENVNLDTVWLGLRTQERTRSGGRSREVVLSLTSVTGPGDVVGYLTGSFGDIDVFFDSRDGIADSPGNTADQVVLPRDAHTHMSWVFTAPGIYRVTFAAAERSSPDAPPQPVGAPTAFTFAVGVPPADAGVSNTVIIDRGHADISVDLDSGDLVTRYDPTGGGRTLSGVYPHLAP